MKRIAPNRGRARAVPLERPGRLAWLAWATLATAILLTAAGQAHAQNSLSPAPAPAQTDRGGRTAPPEMTEPTPGPDSHGQGGVIAPPGTHGPTAPGMIRPHRNVDPGMAVRPPASQTYPTPVVPPPGTPGNPQPVVPK